MLRIIIAILLPFSLISSSKQEEKREKIRLENPSFEGTPQDATTPIGWVACGENSTPDILPGFWGVYTMPSDGNSYIGLTTREDGTWESISQKLSKPLVANECYDFNLDLARSAQYVGFNMPVKLKIWAGMKRCKKSELLAETPLIKHTNWVKYKLKLYPKNDYKFIIFEVHYANGIYFSYKGNILIDNCSALTPCDRV